MSIFSFGAPDDSSTGKSTMKRVKKQAPAKAASYKSVQNEDTIVTEGNDSLEMRTIVEEK